MKVKPNIFKNRRIVIATMHGKEKVIAPIFEKAFKVECVIHPALNTDQLGTFSGEIERKEDVITTLKKKCLLAMELTGCEMAIASEGSFGPHPSSYFSSADDEIVFFFDKINSIEVFGRELTTNTNFSSFSAITITEARTFAKNIGFPSHGLIIRKDKDDFADMKKGICTVTDFEEIVQLFLSQYGKVYFETDMRAMLNPTRMEAIEKATIDLVEKLKNHCPSCDHPGFSVTNVIKGLPCEWCNSPTESTLSFVYICKKCHYTEEKKYPNGREVEDPMYCDRCNP